MSINTKNINPSSKNNLSFEEGFFIAKETYVHQSAIIGPNVKLGDNVKIGPHSIIVGNVSIGANTRIFPHVNIGFPAQDLGTSRNLGEVIIGKNCDIREFASIHASKEVNGKTVVGDSCYLMNFSHIAHDVVLENNVTFINNVSFGGHAHIGSNVMLMANTAVHQFCKIGRFSCITPYSGTRQDLPPFSMFTGQPSQFSGLNRVALKRANFDSPTINAIKHAAKLYYQDKLPLEEIKKLAEGEADFWGSNEYVKEFIEFIESSSRGVSRRSLSYKNAYN